FDVSEIMKYLNMAADNGNSIALFNLGDIYWNGKLGITVNKEKAKSYFELSASKNNPKAIEFLEKINSKI
ncbi:15912_t:CDS:1, partial [Racocetra fulgida]